MSEMKHDLVATLGELADEPIEQTGPTGDFVYIDISSIDRETKKIADPKPLALSQAPSRAKQVLKAGDVLVSMTRPNLNAVALVPEQLDGAIGSTGFHVLRSRWLNPGFLLALVQTQSFIDAMSAVVQGALYPAIRPRDIASYTFSFETPTQQTRIVEKLEELLSDLDAGVAELKAAQKKLAQYRQSLLKAAVEGALTAEWRAARKSVRPDPFVFAQDMPVEGRDEVSYSSIHPSTSSGRTEEYETGAQLLQRILTERRARWEAKQLAKFKEQGKTPPKDWQKKYPEPVQPDTTDLPELPQGWVWSSLGQCFHVAVGATPSRKEPSYWGGSIPWVSSGEVRFSRITTTKEMITQDGLNNSSTQINPIGSVLLGMIGEGKTRGQAAILDVEAANNQNCAAIWASEAGVPSEYVYFWLWSQYEQTRRGSSGNNQPALNKSIVERILFPLAPLDEMTEIARLVSQVLDVISEQEMAIEISLKQSTAQRQNILRAAFAGQLVPQDPNDEPASELLERIRAERAAKSVTKKARRKLPQE